MGSNVAIIGTGYVGLTTGACLAHLGHRVVCADVIPEKVEALSRGEVPILDAGLDELLSQVITGPTEVEQTLGITTAVPAGTIASVDTSRGVAEVDLASSFGDIRSREQILELGQIVYTLTGQPGIGGVRFTVEGKEGTVPLSDGSLSDDPVSRDDFKAVAPK